MWQISFIDPAQQCDNQLRHIRKHVPLVSSTWFVNGTLEETLNSRFGGLFLENIENLSGPKSQLSNCNPVVLKADLLTCQKNQEDYEVWWLCEDIEGIVAPEIDPKSFGTLEKQAPGSLFKPLYLSHGTCWCVCAVAEQRNRTKKNNGVFTVGSLKFAYHRVFKNTVYSWFICFPFRWGFARCGTMTRLIRTVTK